MDQTPRLCPTHERVRAVSVPRRVFEIGAPRIQTRYGPQKNLFLDEMTTIPRRKW